jgi:sugar lactone lactonase YvrE
MVVPPVPITTPIPDRALLGEGPVWDERAGVLWWVDITGRLVHRWDPQGSTTRSFAMAGDTGAVVLREGGGVVVAVELGLWLMDDGGSLTALASSPGDAELRFNDCRADPAGRLWAGTLHRQRARGTAALHTLTAGGPLTCALDGITISNGLGWSPDGTRMYYVDSITQQVARYDYDLDSGAFDGPVVFATIDAADGLPDGLTVDAEGGVWLCLYGGGAIRRYSPDGALDRHLVLPTSSPTCPVFGGADLDTLFVTTARHRHTAAQLAAEPLAGLVLQIDGLGARGLPPHRFAG